MEEKREAEKKKVFKGKFREECLKRSRRHRLDSKEDTAASVGKTPVSRAARTAGRAISLGTDRPWQRGLVGSGIHNALPRLCRNKAHDAVTTGNSIYGGSMIDDE